ncbi:MAG: cysteine peptidase family C39 domain-containing protein [Acidihalobacter sp.]
MRHWSTQSFWGILIGAITLVPVATAKAGEVMVPGVSSGFFSVHVTSLHERKFLSTVHQKYDYSCGSAAVATLLTYQFHDPVSEATVFKAENGYAHFVVIKGIMGDRVLLGDPALGTRVVSRADFLKNWHIRILFVITNANSHATFNNPNDWAANPAAPLGMAVVPSNLLNVTLLLPGPLDF